MPSPPVNQCNSAQIASPDQENVNGASSAPKCISAIQITLGQNTVLAEFIMANSETSPVTQLRTPPTGRDYAFPEKKECWGFRLRVRHSPVPKLYSTPRLMSFDEQATQCQFDVGAVFQLPQFLQKYATSNGVPHPHFLG